MLEQFISQIQNELNRGIIPRIEDYRNFSPKIINDFFHLTFIPIDSHHEIILRTNGQLSLQQLNGDWENIKLNYPDIFFQLALEYLSLNHQISWNYKTPFVSFHYSLNGHPCRFSLLHSQSTRHQINQLQIRRHNKVNFTLNDFTLNPSQTEKIITLIKQKKNIIIAGATGSGKTSFLSACLNHISPKEHLVILEDTPEINSPHPNLTHLVSKNNQAYELTDYCHYSMRLSPQRIILGEMRSSEVNALILMMNTGHKGIMSTIHANSSLDCLHRLATLMSFYGKLNANYELNLKIICQAIDYVIYLDHYRTTEIIQVNGSDQGRVFFEAS